MVSLAHTAFVALSTGAIMPTPLAVGAVTGYIPGVCHEKFVITAGGAASTSTGSKTSSEYPGAPVLQNIS